VKFSRVFINFFQGFPVNLIKLARQRNPKAVSCHVVDAFAFSLLSSLAPSLYSEFLGSIADSNGLPHNSLFSIYAANIQVELLQDVITSAESELWKTQANIRMLNGNKKDENNDDDVFYFFHRAPRFIGNVWGLDFYTVTVKKKKQNYKK
jgi:hypothetical protein